MMVLQGGSELASGNVYCSSVISIHVNQEEI